MKNNYVFQFCLFFLFVGFQSRAQGIYLYIEEITEKSGLVSPHADEVKLTSAQMQMTANLRTYPRGFNSVSFSEYSLTKDLDKSSTELMYKLATGAFIGSVQIRYYNNANQVVSRVELNEVLISSYSASSADFCSSCPALSESFSLSYGKIKVTHQENLDDKTEFIWNVVTNTP